MNIIIILGSIRESSCTRSLANYVERQLTDKGFIVEWVDLKSQPLPIADPEYHADVTLNPSKTVRDFVAKVSRADGIILASPLYHGSYSGVLKNALDNLAYDAFRDKPVGLLSHGSGAKRCAQPAEHLVPIVRTLFGYSLQCQVASSKVDFAINNDTSQPVLIDDGVKSRCERLAHEMRGFCQ